MQQGKGRVLVLVVLFIAIFILAGILFLRSDLPDRLGIIKPKPGLPPSGVLPLPTGTECAGSKLTNEQAFFILSARRNKAMSVDELEKCFSIDTPCIGPEDISENDLEKVALAYEVVENDQCGPKIFLKLQKGSQINVSGIGTGYLKNREALGFDDYRWYWTVNACVNNKRIIIDALTGQQVGPIHTYVICGGVI